MTAWSERAARPTSRTFVEKAVRLQKFAVLVSSPYTLV
jgi:hypothetical protein